MSGIPITSASVKVMRSFDYCHFEVTLGLNEPESGLPATLVDELRKTAARLADKAVEQYKVAKAAMARREGALRQLDCWEAAEKLALSLTEQERTPEQKALLKQLADERFHAGRRYDYEDDWREEDDEDDTDRD